MTDKRNPGPTPEIDTPQARADAAEAAAREKELIAKMLEPGPGAQRRGIKTSAELDWAKAKEAAEWILKQCRDVGFTPPEALDLHQMYITHICNGMNAIVEALKIQAPGAPPAAAGDLHPLATRVKELEAEIETSRARITAAHAILGGIEKNVVGGMPVHRWHDAVNRIANALDYGMKAPSEAERAAQFGVYELINAISIVHGSAAAVRWSKLADEMRAKQVGPLATLRDMRSMIARDRADAIMASTTVAPVHLPNQELIASMPDEARAAWLVALNEAALRGDVKRVLEKTVPMPGVSSDSLANKLADRELERRELELAALAVAEGPEGTGGGKPNPYPWTDRGVLDAPLAFEAALEKFQDVLNTYGAKPRESTAVFFNALMPVFESCLRPKYVDRARDPIPRDPKRVASWNRARAIHGDGDELAPGDVVRLRSGGDPMTIEELTETTRKARCTWWSHGEPGLRRDEIPLAALQRFEPDPATPKRHPVTLPLGSALHQGKRAENVPVGRLPWHPRALSQVAPPLTDVDLMALSAFRQLRLSIRSALTPYERDIFDCAYAIVDHWTLTPMRAAGTTDEGGEAAPHMFVPSRGVNFSGPPLETCDLCGTDPRNFPHVATGDATKADNALQAQEHRARVLARRERPEIAGIIADVRVKRDTYTGAPGPEIVVWLGETRRNVTLSDYAFDANINHLKDAILAVIPTKTEPTR